MDIGKDQLYTTEEVAQILKISVITVKKYIAENKISSIKFNGLRRFRGRDILDIINGPRSNSNDDSNG